MVEKPANQDLSQNLPIFDGTALDTLYEQMIDTTLTQFGRDIILHLEPAKNLPAVNTDTYNPFTGGFDKRLDDSNTGNKGYAVTPITVTYKAHIKHGPAIISDQTPFDLNNNQIAITTVYGAMSDILEAKELEADGLRFLLDKGPRPIGFASTKYIISVWKRKLDGV